MISPPRPPESLGDVLRWAQDLTNFVVASVQAQAPDTLITQTTKGSFRSANPKRKGIGQPGKSAALQWKGKWRNDIDYKKGDIVWTFSDYPDVGGGGLDLGYEFSSYICIEDIGAGGAMPNTIPLGFEDLGCDNPSWDLFIPRLWSTLTLLGIGDLASMRILADTGGYPTEESGSPILVLENTPWDGVTLPKPGARIELDLNLVPGIRVYIQPVRIHNVDTAADELRYFLCSDPYV